MKLLGYTFGGMIVGLILGWLAVWGLGLMGMTEMMALMIGSLVWCLISIVGLGLGCMFQFK